MRKRKNNIEFITSFNINKEYYNQFSSYCIKNNLYIKDVLSKLINNYLKQETKESLIQKDDNFMKKSIYLKKSLMTKVNKYCFDNNIYKSTLISSIIYNFIDNLAKDINK